MKNLLFSMVVALFLIAPIACQNSNEVVPTPVLEQTAAEAVDLKPESLGASLEPMNLAVASVSYTSSPAVGVFTNGSSGALNLNCAKFNGGLKAKIVSINGSQVQAQIQRTDGKSFGAGGTGYVKATSPCGTIAGNSSWQRTDYYFIDVVFNLTFSSGSVSFYPSITLNNGVRMYANPLTFTAKQQIVTDPCTHLAKEQCVIYARCRNGALPYNLFTYDDKVRIINTYNAVAGYTAIIKVGSGTKGNNGVGHVAHVESVSGSTIYIAESNWVAGKITRRSGTASQLGIVGYRKN